MFLSWRLTLPEESSCRSGLVLATLASFSVAIIYLRGSKGSVRDRPCLRTFYSSFLRAAIGLPAYGSVEAGEVLTYDWQTAGCKSILPVGGFFALTKPLGVFMAKVFNREKTFLDLC